MNMNMLSARTALIVLAVVAMSAAVPAVSAAQTATRIRPAAVQIPATVVQVPPTVIQIAPTDLQLPPMTIQVPATSVQVPPVAAQILEQRLEAARKSLDSLGPALDALKVYGESLSSIRAIDALDLSLAELQAQQGRTVVTTRPTVALRVFGDEAGAYESGLAALDNEQWQRAASLFDRVIKAGKTRVDGAMYWKAYALDRLDQRADALSTLQELVKGYPNSRYLDDARALEIEVKQNAGQAVKPEDQANEDLKLMALNSVMQADPERGIPLLEQMIKGHNSLKVKQRALFLLGTSDSPRARDVLAGIARGGGNPDLQLRAIRYLAMRGRTNNTQLLADIYASSKDSDVKREIIRSLMIARDVDHLLNIAKTEPSAELRVEAIRQLGMMRADDQLFQLYSAEKVGDIREQIFRSMVMSGNAERAAELARQETDAKVRASAVRNLGMMDGKKTGDALVQIYKTDKDPGVKKAVVGALHMQQNAKALVDLARGETDAAMKKEIVSRLATMKSKDAIDYMLELLK